MRRPEPCDAGIVFLAMIRAGVDSPLIKSAGHGSRASFGRTRLLAADTVGEVLSENRMTRHEPDDGQQGIQSVTPDRSKPAQAGPHLAQ